MTTATLRPVNKKSTESLVTESLRDYILSGALQPGARLTEIALAEQLGVARATLRTALHRLTTEGIVVQVPYTGWHVATLSADDIREIWTLRGSLESLAARLTAQHIANGNAAAQKTIASAHKALLKACESADMKKISEADFALHRAIIDSSGHKRLASQYGLVEQQVRLYITTSNTQVATGPQDIIEQHAPLANALLDGKPEQAAQEAWLHNESEGNRLQQWLLEQEPSH